MTIDEPVATLQPPAGGVATSLSPNWTVEGTDARFERCDLAPTVAQLGGRLYVYGGNETNTVLISEDGGASWSGVEANWPNGLGFAAGTVFQDQLWVTGGVQLPDGQTWAATDPQAWRQMGGPAAWGPRYQHSLLAFGGRLYLMAGIQGTVPAIEGQPGLMGDVWVLGEDEAWSLVNANAFTPRYAAAAGVVAGKMVLLGGQAHDGNLAEVLVSTDGDHWDTHIAPWTGRLGACAVTIGDTLYMLGGATYKGSSNDIWATRDAVTWTQVSQDAPWFEQLVSAGAAAVDDRIVILGGTEGIGRLVDNPQVRAFTPPTPGWTKLGEARETFGVMLPFMGWLGDSVYLVNGDFDKPVYASPASSGFVTWEAKATNLPFRFSCAGCETENALYVSGGQVGSPGPCRNGVYKTTDGVTWETKTEAAAWEPRSGHSMALFNNRLWVFCGANTENPPNHRYFADAYSSVDDGASWQPETTTGLKSRYGAFPAVFKEKIWLIGGAFHTDAQVSCSSDGVHWQDYPAPWDNLREYMRAHVIGDTLYALGGYYSGVDIFTDVYGTTDGQSWTKVSDGGPWTAGSAFGSFAKFGGIVVLGGFNAAGEYTPDLYGYRPA